MGVESLSLFTHHHFKQKPGRERLGNWPCKEKTDPPQKIIPYNSDKAMKKGPLVVPCLGYIGDVYFYPVILGDYVINP